jgi:hypothetical protein
VAFSTLVASTHQEALAKLIGLYPNPAQQVFWLDIPASLTRKTVSATLYNTLGQQVIQRMLAAAPGGIKTALEVAALPRGVYSLHLTTMEGTLIKRLVVD